MEKDKKKTLTISTNLKKKIDTTAHILWKKKSYSVEKKKVLGPINQLIDLIIITI